MHAKHRIRYDYIYDFVKEREVKRLIGVLLVMASAFVLVLALTGCGGNDMVIEDIIIGDGAEAKKGNTISVNYTGTLEDGTEFETGSYEFQLGAGRVIEGWDKGFDGMKVGGQRKLIIPPEMGYGSQDMGVIPPNSTLIFEVELLDVK
jgi:FKBP-type peptidyl-prolyl cis-trans isomerase